MGKVGGDVAMDIADYLIEEGYGVVWVAKATALEEAAAAIDKMGDGELDPGLTTDWLYNRATQICDEGTRKK